MNDYALLIQEMFNHTIEECIQVLIEYEMLGYEDKVKNRLIQQIQIEKVKQLDYFYELYKEIFNCEYEDSMYKQARIERQSLSDCLIEEVEYLNELQAIKNNIDQSYERLMSNIILIQHQVIYKLLIIERLK